METQVRLGSIPNSFIKYWLDRFPRLLSHSYHALQSCCHEPIFCCYYPSTCYQFSKPRYFYEETEDFKPFDTGSKSRDSPKRFNYKPMNYPNFVMNRKPVQKSQNYAPMNIGDGNLNTNYMRATKKGSYNFHRFFNNDQNDFKPEPTENMKWLDNSKMNDNVEIIRGNGDGNIKIENEEKIESYEIGKEKPIPNVWNIDVEEKEMNVIVEESEKKSEKVEKKKADKSDSSGQSKKEENIKHDKQQKKKVKVEAANGAVNKETEEVDEDGFTKVRYRGHSTTKKQKNTDNVPWIMPGQEKK